MQLGDVWTHAQRCQPDVPMDLADYLPAEALVEGRGPRRKLPLKLLWVRLIPLLPLAVIYSGSTLRHPLVDARWLVVDGSCRPVRTFIRGVAA
jgi:hypothetical protein